MKKVKCILLFSGGLDSILALKVLQENNVIVQPLCFKSNFFNCNSARIACQQFNTELREVDISRKHLQMVKNPEFGYGNACNPCIDCHLMMLREAKEIMEKEGFDFVATGEVLGQRPMSQNINSLTLIEKQAQLIRKIVRPLSLKVLPPTEVEEKGLINRDGFYGISGRSRVEQISLAKKFHINTYPSPSGGCILTEKKYGQFLKQLFKLKPEVINSDCYLLRQGRVLIESDYLMIIARNQNESESILQFQEDGDIVFIPQNFSGPTVFIRPFCNTNQDQYIELGKKVTLQYSKKVPDDYIIEVKKKSA